MNFIWRTSSAALLAFVPATGPRAASSPAQHQKPPDKSATCASKRTPGRFPFPASRRWCGFRAATRWWWGSPIIKTWPRRSSSSFPSVTRKPIYSILISTEGGNFRAENVHKLVGAKATLAGLRHELEEWLPSVDQRRRPRADLLRRPRLRLRRQGLSRALRHRSEKHRRHRLSPWIRWAAIWASRSRASGKCC